MKERITNYLRAGYSGLYITSYEEQRVEATLREVVCGLNKTYRDQPLSLRVDGTDIESKGTLLFTDISVDRSTGQIALRGQFDNPEGVLLPGMYVRVRTPQGLNQNAILVPQRAVQRSADGQASVMLLGEGDTVEVRQVTTGAMQGSRWQISEGLQAGA